MLISQKLTELGWNAAFEKQFLALHLAHTLPARIIADNKISYEVLYYNSQDTLETCTALLTGKVYHAAQNDAQLPAVGDFIALQAPQTAGEDGLIMARLERQSCFSRKKPGKSTQEQVIAANIQAVIIVTEAGHDLNLRRLERYLFLIKRSQATPLIVLNKCDLYTQEHLAETAKHIDSLCPGIVIIRTSCIDSHWQKGLKELHHFLQKGCSMALVGSSGVGKSSLINALLGYDFQETSAINPLTGKGRHTTTSRNLILLEGGGLIIDNPGMREMQLWTDENTLRESFSDIDTLAKQCRFADCKHQSDIGCAITQAVKDKKLSRERYSAYLKLDEEIAHLKKKQKKRHMTLARQSKRKSIQARNLADRIDLEEEYSPHWR